MEEELVFAVDLEDDGGLVVDGVADGRPENLSV
jgi:hypothetical protein